MEKNLEIVKCFCKKVNKLCKKCKIWYNTNKEKQMFGVCKTKKKVEGEMMSAPYSAMELSKYIVDKCIDENQPISNLQLQKILYYVQREFLQNDKVAFCEDIEAWQFGPVVPQVYYHYCGYGSLPITMISDSSQVLQIENEEKRCIDKIVEEKRCLQPWDLVEETHKPDGAWDTIFQNGKGLRNVIPKDLIKQVG